jgi:hypothetical protein
MCPGYELSGDTENDSIWIRRSGMRNKVPLKCGTLLCVAGI